MDWILPWLNSGLAAGSFGLTIFQVLRSQVARRLPQEEERALVGAFWQLVSFRVAFSATQELLQRAELFETSDTLRPDATQRKTFIQQQAKDERRRSQDYYADSQHHLRRLGEELKMARPEEFINGTDDAWTAQQLRKIQGLVLRLQRKDIELRWAVNQVDTTLNTVHSNVARMMRQRFGNDLFGVQSPVEVVRRVDTSPGQRDVEEIDEFPGFGKRAIDYLHRGSRRIDDRPEGPGGGVGRLS